MSKEFTLGRTERLKHRKLIEQLFKEGRQFSVFPFRVKYLFQDKLPAPLQAGFTASTRNFKKAVDRNRIRRVTKEAYRIQKNELNNLLKDKNKNLAIFFIYTDKQLPAFGVIKDRINVIFQKFITIIHEMDSSHS